MLEKFRAFTATLFDTNQAPSRYILNAAGRILIIAIPFSILLGILFPNVDPPDFSNLLSSPLFLFLTIVIAAPLLETLVMWPVIAMIRLFTKVTWQVAVVSALFWGFLHWQQSPLQGVVTTWSFWVMSVCFIVWRRHSLGQGYFYTAGVHALNNLVAFVLMLPLLMMEQPAGDNSLAGENSGNYRIEIVGREGEVTGTVTGLDNNTVIRNGDFTLRHTDGILSINGQRINVSEQNIVINTSDPNNILVNGQPYAELFADEDAVTD